MGKEYLLSDLIIDLAVDLTKRHPLRGYDAVHLATAVTLNDTLLGAGLPTLTFASADKILCEAATSEGISIYKPS